jgi:hypothetical protein
MSDAAAGAAPEQPRPQAPPQASGPQTEQDTYTERLLAAKKKAKKQ